MKATTALTALAASLVLAACGSSRPSAAAPPSTSAAAAPTTAAAPAAPALTCADFSADLSGVVHDLKVQDAHYQEAWVSGGDGHELRALMDDTESATSGGNQVESDAATFYSDASTYLSDNSPYLAPGWQGEYNTVTRDINALATDCHQKTAPSR